MLKEIERYLSLPCVFDGFIDTDGLDDGVISLVCTAKNPAVPEKNYVPAYFFDICRNGDVIGGADIRIGYSEGLFYGGHIGYHINENFRGNGYAGRACALLKEVARAHKMTKLLITNDVNNLASRRVCEKMGLKHICLAALPEWTELYADGQRFENIYEMDV